MALASIQNKPVWEQVHEVLKEEITEGKWPVGSKLPSMRQLGSEVGASHQPVQRAIEKLEREGYVEKRHGSGTYVIDTDEPASMSDSFALSMDAHGHIWGDLVSMVAGRIQDTRGHLSIVDRRHPNHLSTLVSLARSGVRRFMLRGNKYFDYNVFTKPVFQDCTIIGLVHWFGPDLPGLSQILSDEREGGRMLAEHVWGRGHRHVILCAVQLEDFLASHHHEDEQHGPLHGWHGRAFLNRWQERGGRWTTVQSRVDETSRVSVYPDDVVKPFREFSADPPTAIVGLRDVDALRAYQALQGTMPDAADDVELFGYFNTPWSQAADPPFTSVDLNLDRVAERAAATALAAMSDTSVGQNIHIIEPELIER